MNKLKMISIFVEIADQGSMSAAARSLGVVNSVVSKNLNELESWLGKRLVYRSTRNLRLTQDGMNYLPECREILTRVERLESNTHPDDEEIRGQVNITAPVYFGQLMLAPILAGFHKAYPLITVNLKLSDQLEDMVKRGFDIALRASQMPDSSFVSRRLAPVSLKLLASPEYIQSNGTPSSLKELDHHQCIVEGDSNSRRRWPFRNKNGKQISVSTTGSISVNYGGAVKALCIAGHGLSQLPDFMVRSEIDSGELVELLPEYALENFYIHLLYHHRSRTNSAVRAVIDHVINESGSMT